MDLLLRQTNSRVKFAAGAAHGGRHQLRRRVGRRCLFFIGVHPGSQFLSHRSDFVTTQSKVLPPASPHSRHVRSAFPHAATARCRSPTAPVVRGQ